MVLSPCICIKHLLKHAKKKFGHIPVRDSDSLYPTCLQSKSNYNYLWVLTKKYFYKISYNGLIIYKTENEYEYSKLGFYNDNVLLSNSSEIFHFKNKEELLVKINLEKLFIKDFFVINETLYIYDKDHLNKYLILSY